MYFISFEEAAAQNPEERLYALEKEGGKFTLIADIQENANLEDDEMDLGYPIDLRVGVYGWYGGDWSLDYEVLLDPQIVATSEVCGRNAGGICFDYEDLASWAEWKNAYWCLYANVPDAHDQVAVISDAHELFDLEDGDWFVLCEHDGLWL